MSLKLVSTLLHLASADGQISGSEMALIYKIAMAKGLSMFDVEQLTSNPGEHQELDTLSDHEKYEYIYTIILMIKMDGRLDQRELEACTQYAVSMGYDQAVIDYLLEIVESDFDLNENKEELKAEIQKFLKATN